MAVLKISQQPLKKYREEWVLVIPKPQKYQNRIKVILDDEIVKSKEEQPVLDAYAMAINKPEWVGKTMEWYRNTQGLELGFHIISFDDGTPVIDMDN